MSKLLTRNPCGRVLARRLHIATEQSPANTTKQQTSNATTPLSKQDVCKVPLDQPLPGMPHVVYPKPSPAKDLETKVTVMSNGLKVASEKRFGQYCIAGVAINSGSRLESSYPSGVTHFIERTAFKSTSKFFSRNHILEHLSNVGGTLDCQGSRDLMVYAVSVFNDKIGTAVDVLGEAVLRPRFSADEIRETANRISFELEDMGFDPERKTLLNEMIHAAAYGNNSVGLPKVCPESNLAKIDSSIMFNFMKHNHTPDRMVLAGVGVEHDRLLDFAQEHFVEKPAIWKSSPDLVCDQPRDIKRPKASYTGGINAVSADLSNVSLGPTPMPNLVHFQLGFEVCSYLNLDEFVVVCVMNMLMGGGGSFSAGGPGKGMFTRLFTNVLNRYHWVHSCAAHNSGFEDSGLFYIQSSSDPSRLKSLVDVVIDEFNELANGPIYKDELARAKKQLISMLWLNLEIRPIVFEDIARQVLSTGFRRQPSQLIKKIEAVTDKDIQRVAKKMLATNPTVACLGDLTYLPSYDYIRSRFR